MGAQSRSVKGMFKNTVNATRHYDVTARQARAHEQHVAALDSAERLFLERGYGRTTVDAIAAAAGLSSSTVYKSYGGKTGLIRELSRRALEGEGATPAEQRSDALRSATDPRVVIDGWASLVTEVAPRVAPLLLMLRSAARSDDEAGALYDELDGQRLERMADNARFLATAGHLREGRSVADARDIMWFCTAPETYELMVLRRGWSVRKFSRFLAELLKAELL